MLRSTWAYVAADKVAAMASWPEACIKLDPWPLAELGEASRVIDVQLRVMEVDEMQLGDGAEKDRRTILVEPGTGGDRESFQVKGPSDHRLLLERSIPGVLLLMEFHGSNDQVDAEGGCVDPKNCKGIAFRPRNIMKFNNGFGIMHGGQVWLLDATICFARCGACDAVGRACASRSKRRWQPDCLEAYCEIVARSAHFQSLGERHVVDQRRETAILAMGY